MVQCPSCARPSEPRLICPDCGAPLGAELDLFAALGVPRKLVLDPSELEFTRALFKHERREPDSP